ncbi:alpha/beta fold hydrolase [Rhodococcus sp. 06-1460-1B]|uniref:alpha/beta fold hydrolase n=1 Tax=Rhodococcus sp. 06-1460-1B TaxID=2022501 RepID=UPI000B9BD1AD|nr:alpha/beta fold hydrolase [Rhodococcus sp. 06-1460-1B]OZD60946.1 prolyl aminopeptidase [Rhodococcus sp. 06-1460-1B]
MTPEEEPTLHGVLDVGDGQSVYWEQWGPSDGVPAVYLHGGPGGTLNSSQFRRHFDLSRVRAIGFEQRGCGRSTPHASDPSTSLATNTTAHLIADIEALRVHLGAEAWIVNGASWGSTLALAYALAHPTRVLGMVLVAVTTTGRAEVDWITEGVGAVFPEAWDRFATFAEQAGVGYRRGEGRIVDAYNRLFNSNDLTLRDSASREWALWEDIHISIGTDGVRRNPRWDDDRFRLAFVRLAAHYWSHDGFCDPPLLDRADGLRDVPGVLIHGRKDVSGPAVTPWHLHRRWPGSTLVIDEGDGHGGLSMAARWDAANEELTKRALQRPNGA